MSLFTAACAKEASRFQLLKRLYFAPIGTILSAVLRKRLSRIASKLGLYWHASRARLTASIVSGDTFVDPLTTRETVAVETPATRATSMIVADGELFSTEFNPRCLPHSVVSP